MINYKDLDLICEACKAWELNTNCKDCEVKKQNDSKTEVQQSGKKLF